MTRSLVQALFSAVGDSFLLLGHLVYLGNIVRDGFLNLLNVSLEGLVLHVCSAQGASVFLLATKIGFLVIHAAIEDTCVKFFVYREELLLVVAVNDVTGCIAPEFILEFQVLLEFHLVALLIGF